MAEDIVGSNMKSACGYGRNGPQPSSLRPGEHASADGIDTKPPGGDAALDSIKASGSGAVDPPQVKRSYPGTSRGSVPDHRDMKSANDGGAPAGKVR